MSEQRSEWTLDSLHTLMCVKIAAIERLVDDRFAGSDRHHQAVRDERDMRYQQRFEAQQESLRTAFETARIALEEAKNASVVGFEKSNEWRATLNDVMQTRLPRAEYIAEHSALADKVDMIISRLDIYQGARPIADKGNWRDILSVISIIVAIIAAVIVAVTHHPF